MLVLEPPIDAYNNVENLKRWIARLDEFAQEFEGDEESLADIAVERRHAEAALVTRSQQEREAAARRSRV